jgi:hypothetical protein
MADACVRLMNLSEPRSSMLSSLDKYQPPLINVGCGDEVTIAGTRAQAAAEVVGYDRHADVRHEQAGRHAARKLMDVSRMFDLGWRPKVSLREGIARSLADPVIPAKAGIQSGGGSRDVRCWTPAFAGVTGWLCRSEVGLAASPRNPTRTVVRATASDYAPAALIRPCIVESTAKRLTDGRVGR